METSITATKTNLAGTTRFDLACACGAFTFVDVAEPPADFAIQLAAALREGCPTLSERPSTILEGCPPYVVG